MFGSSFRYQIVGWPALLYKLVILEPYHFWDIGVKLMLHVFAALHQVLARVKHHNNYQLNFPRN